jgi:hypothetical protein
MAPGFTPAPRRALADRSPAPLPPAPPPCGATRYASRRPQAAPLQRVLADHFDTLTHLHEERYEPTRLPTHGLPVRPAADPEELT